MSVQSSHRHNSQKFQCNHCLTELKLFQETPSTGSHANKCYLTNCHHIQCHNCKIRFPGQCAACHQQCKFMEINQQMPSQYKAYFEPKLQVQQNLIGAMKFQQDQNEHILTRTIAMNASMKTKVQQLKTTYKDAQQKHQQILSEQRKLMIIFKKICEEKKRITAERQERQLRKQAEKEKFKKSRLQKEWTWTPGLNGIDFDTPQSGFDDSNQGHFVFSTPDSTKKY